MNSSTQARKTFAGTIFHWARLVRATNTLTVVADVVAGAALTGLLSQSIMWVALGTLASVLIYWVGMIRNDVVDLDYDRSLNRNRPLVDGAITLKAAQLGIFILSAVAIGISIGISALLLWDAMLSESSESSRMRLVSIPAVHTGLLGLVVLYNTRWKLTFVGPVVMGACRAVNLLSGAIIAWAAADSPLLVDIIGGQILMAVAAMWIYVSGFTLAGRKEDEPVTNQSDDAVGVDASELKVQKLGWSFCIFGILLFGLVPFVRPSFIAIAIEPAEIFLLLIAVVALPVVRRIIRSFRYPAPATIGAAIRQCILGIIGLDAALVACFGGAAAGLAVAALLIPTYVLAQFFRST